MLFCSEVFSRLELYVERGVKRRMEVVKAFCLGAKVLWSCKGCNCTSLVLVELRVLRKHSTVSDKSLLDESTFLQDESCKQRSRLVSVSQVWRKSRIHGCELINHILQFESVQLMEQDTSRALYRICLMGLKFGVAFAGVENKIVNIWGVAK